LRLTEAWPARFEDGLPVRQLRARKGQRHLSGLWWSATMGRHLGFESWLERDHAMLLDFDSAVVGIASQPFWLSWRDSGGGSVSHCPDYFVRRADGSAVVVDCRPVDRRPDKDIAKFDATAAVCGELGWGYDLVGATEPVLTANVRWLAGYRHPRHDQADIASRLQEVFAEPVPLVNGASVVGDPIGVLPTLFRLLWCGELVCDLTVPLHAGTVVRMGLAGDAGGGAAAGRLGAVRRRRAPGPRAGRHECSAALERGPGSGGARYASVCLAWLRGDRRGRAGADRAVRAARRAARGTSSRRHVSGNDTSSRSRPASRTAPSRALLRGTGSTPRARRSGSGTRPRRQTPRA